MPDHIRVKKNAFASWLGQCRWMEAREAYVFCSIAAHLRNAAGPWLAVWIVGQAKLSDGDRGSSSRWFILIFRRIEESDSMLMLYIVVELGTCASMAQMLSPMNTSGRHHHRSSEPDVYMEESCSDIPTTLVLLGKVAFFWRRCQGLWHHSSNAQGLPRVRIQAR